MMKYSGIVVLSTAAIALHGCGDKDEDVKATEAVYKSELDAMKEATKKAKAEYEKLNTAAPAKKEENKKEAQKICDAAKAATDKKVKEAKDKKDKKDKKESSFVQEDAKKKEDEKKKKTPDFDAFTLEYKTCMKVGVEVPSP